eukprot:scaffold32480_cov68-Phaeocystis_antarctica.AAC.3
MGKRPGLAALVGHEGRRGRWATLAGLVPICPRGTLVRFDPKVPHFYSRKDPPPVSLPLTSRNRGPHIVEGGDQLSEFARPLCRVGGSGVWEGARSGAKAPSKADDWLPASLQPPGAPPRMPGPTAQAAAAAQVEVVAAGGAVRKCSGAPACLRWRRRCCGGGGGRLGTTGSGAAPPSARRSSPTGPPSSPSSGKQGGGSISDADKRRGERNEGGKRADTGCVSPRAAIGEGTRGVGARSSSPRLKGVAASSSCARSHWRCAAIASLWLLLLLCARRYCFALGVSPSNNEAMLSLAPSPTWNS